VCLAAIAAIALTGCRLAGDPDGGALRYRAGPAAGLASDALPPEVVAAERALRLGRPDQAERILEAAGGLDVRAPERAWLWIDLGLARARTEEVRRAVDALPDGPLATVFRAHARSDPRDRVDRVRGVHAGPAAPWAELERAHAFAAAGERHEAVRGAAERAAATGPRYVRREAWLVAGRDALEDDDASRARAAADRAASEDPSDPRPAAFAARAASRLGRRDDAALAALEALRLQPTSARAARRLADLVRDGVSPPVEARCRVEAGAIAGRSASGEALALAGLIEERAGAAAGAVDRYRRALAAGCDPVPVDRHLRRLLFAQGGRVEALALLRRAVPPEAFTNATSLRHGAWRRLAAEAARATDGPTSSAALLALAEALVGVGAVDEAAAVLAPATTASAAALRDRARRQVAFEAAVRAAVEDGYRAPATGAPPAPVETLLASIADAARHHLAPDEAAAFERPTTGLRRVPLLGAWLDHAADPTSPVVAHFRRYGKYLMLGQREGKPAEVILLSMASLTRKQPLVTQGRAFTHDVMLGYDRTIRSYVDFQGGGLSGAALPDGVWLDADATRREDHALRVVVRAVDATFVARLDAAAAAPPVPDGVEGVFALDDPAGLWLRLARRYVAQVGDAPWGSLDVLRAHEFGHVIDLDRHLPIAKGLPATLGLLASEGFAFGRVEARLEGRAQLGAVIDAARPDLALLDLVAPLPLVETRPEAHDRGSRDVTAAIVRHVARHPERFPQVDPARKLLPQLDRLSLDEIRAVARAVAAAGWNATAAPVR